MSLALLLPSSLTVGPLAPYKSCVSHSCIVCTCVDRDSTTWFFILFYFTLVAEPRSSASGLDRSTQQGELRSSAMSGATDRREDEQVPQFYGRIDEKFAEWETDVRLWQVEFKVEDRDRLGPILYRRGLHRQPKIIVKTKAWNKRCCTVHSGEHHLMPQKQRVWRTS